MSDRIQKKIKKEFNEADNGIKKAGVVAAVAALAPAVGIGIAAEKAAGAAKDVVGKIKEDGANAQLRKFNPLSIEEFTSEGFKCSNMVTIVDESEKKKQQPNLIGWRSIENDMEVLHLYNSEVQNSMINFVPAAMCHAVYFVDPHDNKRYINVENLYEKMQQQKMAELAEVAFCLGAKSYFIEIIEEESTVVKKQGNAGVKAKALKANADLAAEFKESLDKKAKRLAFQEAKFSKQRKPVMPELCWFKNDPVINGLIKQICRGKGDVKSNDLVLEGSKYAVMSQSTAAKIEGAMKKIGVKTSVDFNQEAKSEFSSKIHLHLEF